MTGTGREQDGGAEAAGGQNAGKGGHPLPDDSRIENVPETLRREKDAGDNLDLEGAPSRAESKQAVRNQAVVSPDDYGGTAESGA